MRPHLPLILLLAGCGGRPAAPATTAALVLPDSTAVLDAASGRPISTAELLRRARAADLVFLGELHDNPAHHEARAAILAAADRHPAVVFEQLAWSTAPIAMPAAGEPEESWLAAHGYDLKGWRWPLHRPVVDAALAHARGIWGSYVPREDLISVVRGGIESAPDRLGRLVTAVPLDSAATAAVDRELIEGHCGKLPASMIPGMRAAQEVRDAAMADALLGAAASGPAWLIAGDGHVRMDMGVPRLLRSLAPDKSSLVVGFVERGTGEARPGREAAARYQVLIVTPPAAREDPCAGL